MFPELMDLMLGLLHQECVLTVPKVYQGGGLTAGQQRKMMGYQEKEDPERPGRWDGDVVMGDC